MPYMSSTEILTNRLAEAKHLDWETESENQRPREALVHQETPITTYMYHQYIWQQ